MKIVYKTGDIFDGNEPCMIHGCNAQYVMASGIAAQVRATYPEAYEAYKNQPKLELGDTIWVKCHDGRTVINAVTQDKYGRNPNIVYADYDAIRQAVRYINAICFEMESKGWDNPIKTIAFPLIGAGLANGSWKEISKIIEEESFDFQPVVYLYDGVMPTT